MRVELGWQTAYAIQSTAPQDRLVVRRIILLGIELCFSSFTLLSVLHTLSTLWKATCGDVETWVRKGCGKERRKIKIKKKRRWNERKWERRQKERKRNWIERRPMEIGILYKA